MREETQNSRPARAPSAYEAGFLSTAHDGATLDRACEVMTNAIRDL